MFNDVEEFLIIIILLIYFCSISSSDNGQKLIYKRILRGGDIPSNGLQKISNNNTRGRNIKFSISINNQKIFVDTFIKNNVVNINIFRVI
jgi:hypothetical protein